MGLRQPLLLLLLLLVSACVTINIYFPAAAAEEAADRIIEEVWGKEPRAPAAPGNEQSHRAHSAWERLATRWLEWLVAPAHAAEADLNVATAAIERLKAGMRERHARLEPHYASGALGLTGDGLVAQRDPAIVPLRERTQVKKLVADENTDRNALYREIARANGHPEWEPDIRATFARRWVDNARAGWWYAQGEGWVQKR